MAAIYGLMRRREEGALSEQTLLELSPALRSRGASTPDPFVRLSRKSPPKALREARQKLDGFRCAACGFVSAKYQTVTLVGPSPRVLGDLRTLCRSCWLVMNLEAAASAKSAALIHLPEISQVELNAKMPMLYIARVSTNEMSSRLAKRILTVLRARRDRANEMLDLVGLDELVEKLQDVGADSAEGARLLGLFQNGLRSMPLDRWIAGAGEMEYNEYPQMLAFWRAQPGVLSQAANNFPLIAQDWLERLGETAEATPEASVDVKDDADGAG